MAYRLSVLKCDGFACAKVYKNLSLARLLHRLAPDNGDHGAQMVPEPIKTIPFLVLYAVVLLVNRFVERARACFTR